MDYIIRAFKPGEEEYVARLHERLYTEEYSWGPSFTYYAMKIALDFAQKERSPREALFVAECDGRLMGSIMLCETENPEIGQLRLFAVEKDCRGKGIGHALLATFMDKAKSAGYKKLLLWTASPLVDAIGQYEALGFESSEWVENTTWSTVGETVYEIKMELQNIN